MPAYEWGAAVRALTEGVHGSARPSVREDFARQGTSVAAFTALTGGEFASPVTVRRAHVIVLSRRRYTAPEIAGITPSTFASRH